LDRLIPLTPAVFYEREAALYIKLNIHAFRDLVRSDEIPCFTHVGRKRRIYLKADLDEYLRRLPRVTMTPVEDSPRTSKKGDK
ncbi:MAG TPA: helix-turn-helix domain-containing protein, partial [Acidobacteriota bacterium]